jgi:hypothetical protein
MTELEKTLIIPESEVPVYVKEYINGKENIPWDGYIIREGCWLNIKKREKGIRREISFENWLKELL